MQTLALNGEWENALILSICFEGIKMRDHSVWANERNVGSSISYYRIFFTEKMFKQNTCECQHSRFLVRG